MEFLTSLFTLNGKTVVVTGGSGILGSAIARGLSKAGASIVLIGRNKDKLDHVRNSLEGSPKQSLQISCDVTSESELQAANKTILDQFGRIDVLINGAGGNRPGATLAPDTTFFEINPQELRAVVDLNLFGTMLPSFVFGKSIAAGGRGSIINISSAAAQRAISRVVGYSVAKGAIENFTRWLAVEAARKYGDAIRVNAIAPGFFLTEQNRSLLTNPDGSLTARGNTIVSMTPFNRFGKPDELIGAALWLASEASSFVTGTVITVDGGFGANSGV